MAYIKRMVLHGFKSFAKRTEIIFDNGINTVVGPNGSGKSNIMDALCFVLGRLSIKSMRAAKTKNLIFMGSKYVKPAKEASVEIVFDNSDRKFSIDKDEISIKRIVRVNGQGIYKLNGETKTRTEIIEILAHAGIDPYGFNIILQGEIQSIVKMHSEERRKIIEEVAGISIYESRKEKSLKELEKTEEKLKEIGTILRDRTAYLNNLEKEKAQAQKYKELKALEKRLKASIIKKKLDEKIKEIEIIEKAINEKTAQKNRMEQRVEKSRKGIEELSNKINQINKHVQKASGVEQSQLRDEITNLRADLEGLRVRKEGQEHRREETLRRISEIEKQIPEQEKEIQELRNQKPGLAQKALELKKKKEELAELEKERKKVLTLKSELNSLREMMEDKQKQLTRAETESESLLNQIEELTKNLNYKNTEECLNELRNLKNKLANDKKEIAKLREKEVENEKLISIAESEIKRNKEIKEKVEKIDVCPLCQSKMTESHIKHVFKDCDLKINEARKRLKEATLNLKNIKEKKKKLSQEIEEGEKKIYSCQKELNIFKSVDEKKELLKKEVEYEKALKEEIEKLSSRKASLEGKTSDLAVIENKYHEKILEIEEISSRTEEDVDTTLLYKEREIEKLRNIILRAKEDLEDIEIQIQELTETIEEKEASLERHEKKEEELEKRFKRMYMERDNLQKKIQEENIELASLQNEMRQIEEQINLLKVSRAGVDGEKQTIEIDLEDFHGVEIVQGSLNYLEERLRKTQETLETIGNINMRALEVYDSVKKEYETIRERVETLEKEKSEVLRIIEEIDRKKYRTFMKSFKAINSLFSMNFSKLYTKGVAYLEIENKEDVFSGGVNIVVKLAKGKYFDINSLSGGEKTLVALSLLFAIQEYKPYQFYVLDEIDAALDKRNSERLAALLNQHMKSGQYIVISHNDAMILNSQLLYGVSMHEGVSKILSLHLNENNKS